MARGGILRQPLKSPLVGRRLDYTVTRVLRTHVTAERPVLFVRIKKREYLEIFRLKFANSRTTWLREEETSARRGVCVCVCACYVCMCVSDGCVSPALTPKILLSSETRAFRGSLDR